VKLVTAAQMKEAEDAANAAGLTYDAMMENAGRAVAQAIEEQFGATGRHITILIGPGNNGGDGLVAARYLSDLGASVSLYVWKRRRLETDPNWQRLESYVLPTIHRADDPQGQKLADLIERSAIVVDALLGTGVSRPIEGDLADLLRTARDAIDRRRALRLPLLADPIDPPPAEEIGPAVVAVDLPSGLHTDTGALDPLTLPADLTITFAAPKRGQVLFPGAAYVGQLLIADIGIRPEYLPDGLPQLATTHFIAGLLPARPLRGHKGTFGRAMIAAGCLNYCGAPALAASAAYRVGAGLVTLAVAPPVQRLVAPKLTEATYLLLPHQEGAIAAPAADALAQGLTGYSALLVGPGLGQAETTAQFLDSLLPQLPDIPLALDADALNLLAKQSRWWTRLPPETIITPHPGEMSRLSGTPVREIEANRLDFVPEMAHQWGTVIVYKGAFTVVAAPEGETVVMPFANPALATAGSGDVLAGAIAGMLAQRLPPFEAAVAGAYLHGLAGELARERFWEAGVVAGDLLPLLPLAIKELAG